MSGIKATDLGSMVVKKAVEEADQFSYESHYKALEATLSGVSKDETSPVFIGGKKIVFDEDRGIRRDTTIEILSKLKPVFKTNGRVTVGNSSRLSDGSSALVIASESFAKELGLNPLAIIEAYGESGVSPELVMEAHIPATKNVFKKG